MIRILLARRYVTGDIDGLAHLDDTKFLEDGTTPDPVWTLAHQWHVNPEDWQSRTPAQKEAWANALSQEFAELCRAQLRIVEDREAGGTVLPIEGQAFQP
jgi:hypothetical protein